MLDEKTDLKVVRSHEDFLWLHSVIEENPAYAGLIIPPRCPTFNVFNTDPGKDLMVFFSGHPDQISKPHRRD